MSASASVVASLAELTVVVPARNAGALLDDCLASVVSAGPREVIVVDGRSTDDTVEVARRHGATLLSDDGTGLPRARLIGVEAASTPWVALVDADVVLPDGALEQLLREFVAGDFAALQAGLRSEGGPGYWGRALADHHRSGRSKDWFGLVATIFHRDTLLEHGFDPNFLSGEDIELRWRLERAGARIGVSRRTVVRHRFQSDTFAFARSQWLADGHGLGRMIAKHRWSGAWLAVLPAAAGLRGAVLAVGRLQPRWVPYYLGFATYNYVGMARQLRERPVRAGRR
ncbi:MAG TPA: glycosyltransferase [Acidimicrobiales bacterium]|nr:glycosyltransferase [Acidimicrobiales bacterium]